MTKKTEIQESKGGHGKSLAVTFIGAALGLLVYCGSFYAKAYMENREAMQSYDALRKACLTGELMDGNGDRPGSSSDDDTDADTDVAYGSAGRKIDMEAVDGRDGLSNDEPDSERTEADKPAVPESFGISWENLYKVNHDIVAWVVIPGADISYPVVQGEDDEFYLHHSISKEEDPFGTIFLGCGNTRNFSDSHSFLYGHNMEGNMMFANLNRYEDSRFFDRCPEFVIYTPEEMYRYRIFSVEQAGEQSPCFQYGYKLGSKEYKTQLNMLSGNSMYQTGIIPDSNEPMVTLVTCNSRLDEHIRMTIHGIRSEVIGAETVQGDGK